jgi:ribonuclease HI
MYFDGSLNIDSAGVGVLFISPTKEQLCYVFRISFPASNNAAEYEVCLHGMRIAVELGVKHLYVYDNLALVINQLNKDWDMTSEKMDACYKEIIKLEGKFYGIEYKHVVRDKNQVVDELSKLGSSRVQVPHGVLIQYLVKPSIKEEADQVVEKPPDQPLVATVPPPSTMESSPKTPAVPPTINTDDWRVSFIKCLQEGSGYAN